MDPNHECLELRNLKYKSKAMVNTGAVSTNNHADIESILERDRDHSRISNDPWNKLDKTIKVQKLLHYADDISIKENLSRTEKQVLRNQLIGYLDKKLLQRNRDVTYDTETQAITAIPTLDYNTTHRRFTLRRGSKTVNSITSTKTRKRSDKGTKVDATSKINTSNNDKEL